MAEHNTSLRLKEIHITGYKAVDDLQLSFPEIEMKGDPNLFVMGSKNGVGKTSIMEAISALYLVTLNLGEELTGTTARGKMSKRLYEMPKREGSDLLLLKGIFEINGEECLLRYTSEAGKWKLEYPSEYLPQLKSLTMMFKPEMLNQSINSLYGQNNEPLYLPSFMYFHSFRKVQEGNLGMGMLVDDTAESRKTGTGVNENSISLFKIEILRALMSQGGLFETTDKNDSLKTLQVLNDLVREFAGGTIDKLRPAPDNTMEFRVTPIAGGDTYSFDGLSSGQKEMISTLFMIWHHTKGNPSIVLIDEPELHLNSEWHRKFVQYLNKLAPQNQYILATHSEDIFASVDPERRIFLEPGGGGQ